MKAYVAIMFASKDELISYGRDVQAALHKLSNGKTQRIESTAGVTAIGFVSDAEYSVIFRTCEDLWRKEQRTWVFPLETAVVTDAKLHEWARRQIPV